MDVRDEISKRKRENWIEVEFNIEALGVAEEIVESSLNRHVDKLSHVKDVFIYEKNFKDIQKVENPLKHIKEAYSQVVKLKFFVKDLSTLLRIVITYGPSSIEVLGPNKKEINAAEIQDISNSLAGIIHQFAAAGAGGIVITPDEKKK